MSRYQSAPRFSFSLSLFLVILLSLIAAPIFGLDCTKAKRDWLTYRYKVFVTGTAPQPYHQPVCPMPEGNTCCDKQMEMDIYAFSERELLPSLVNWLVPVAEQMETDSVALDYFFRSDLTEARNRLHEAFSGIYGYNYKVNHAFFFQFFNDLEAYMAGRRGDLTQLVTSFFNQLRTSIVVLMEKAEVATGSAITPDSRRINCLSEALGKQNAFDLTDVRLREHFLQVYPPARMVVNALATGSKLLRTLVEDFWTFAAYLPEASHLRVGQVVKWQAGEQNTFSSDKTTFLPTAFAFNEIQPRFPQFTVSRASKLPECIATFSRLRYCATYCGAREGPQAEICPSDCNNFIKACFFAASSDSPKSLPRLWSQFITAITATTKRLERTHNFASVNKDLHIFLSEAITYVHQKYATVKPSLVQECQYAAVGDIGEKTSPPFKPPHFSGGWPYPSRSRRSADNSSDTGDSLRIKRQASYPSGAWQSEPSSWGAPPGSLANSQQQQQQPPPPPPPQQQRPFYHSYFTSNRRGGGGSGNVADSPSTQPTNAPEKLIKWATQLRLYYSGVQDLFARTPSSVCVGAAQTNSACYSPPPVPPATPTNRYTTTASDLTSLIGKLDLVNNQNNGDPEALELGARILAEAKMRNISSPSHGAASLLQPLSPAGPAYGQSQLGSHDPWRTGAANSFAPVQPIQPPPSSSSDNDNQYSLGAPYQMQSAGAPFSNHMDMDAAESGYVPSGGVPPPQPGYAPPPGQPGFPSRPSQPDFSSPHARLPAPGAAVPSQHLPPSNQPWSGPADAETSGLGESNSWSQGGPWQHQMVPPSNPWEPRQPPQILQQPSQSQTQPQLPPAHGSMDGNYQWQNNYYPDQQGSGDGDGVFLGPETYPQPQPQPQPPPPPPSTERVSTTPTTPLMLTTMTALVTGSSVSTATATTAPVTISSDSRSTLPPIPHISEGAVRPIKPNISSVLPEPPPSPRQIDRFDDEDLEPPTALPQPLPTSTQRPWEPHQPVPGLESGINGFYPGEVAGGEEGRVPPLEPSLPPPPELPDGPPDCSPEGRASAGSGVDPRCLPGGEPGQPVSYLHPDTSLPDWQSPGHLDFDDGNAGSGLPPGGLEPPPPPPPYPGYVGETAPAERPGYGGLPDFEGLAPLTETPLPPGDVDRSYLSPTATQKLPLQPTVPPPTVPPREPPPDIWLPVPELQPGEPQLPDSKLFLPDFPFHRGRPTVGDGKRNTAGAVAAYSRIAVIAYLLITANLLA